MNTKFQQLVKLFQHLPGVGPRQATRFVIALLDHPEEHLLEFSIAIGNLKRDISFCGECFNVSENSNCHICHDTKRDKSKLMVVEKITDLESVEKTGLYRGLYHVLGGAINPLDKITPASLKIKELEKRLDKMLRSIEVDPVRGRRSAFGERLASNGIELIIATNPNTHGETTASYLRDLFANTNGISITRLGRGLSSGSNLEYTDDITLKNALDYRK